MLTVSMQYCCIQCKSDPHCLIMCSCQKVTTHGGYQMRLQSYLDSNLARRATSCRVLHQTQCQVKRHLLVTSSEICGYRHMPLSSALLLQPRSTIPINSRTSRIQDFPVTSLFIFLVPSTFPSSFFVIAFTIFKVCTILIFCTEPGQGRSFNQCGRLNVMNTISFVDHIPSRC